MGRLIMFALGAGVHWLNSTPQGRELMKKGGKMAMDHFAKQIKQVTKGKRS